MSIRFFVWLCLGLWVPLAGAQEFSELKKQLIEDVKVLSQEIGPRSMDRYAQLQEAERYITRRFKKMGYSVQRQEYPVGEKVAVNLIAEKLGTVAPEEIVLIGAHYDSFENPGADDNASGVAGLLSLAQAMRKQPTYRTLRFVAFTNEEAPYIRTPLMGSWVYARRAREQNEKIHAALILEMIGYYTYRPKSQEFPPFFGIGRPHQGNFIAIIGYLKHRWLVRQVAEAFRQDPDLPVEQLATFSWVEGLRRSDTWSFWKEGYPTLMISDTASYRNPYYHTSYDTWEMLDYVGMTQTVQGLIRAVESLAVSQKQTQS